MKFCYECGCKLEGGEDKCPQCGTEFDDINVNKRSTDRVFFESEFIQSLSNQLDIFFEDANQILKDFDSSELKRQFDDIDIIDITMDTLDQFNDIKDETLKNVDFDEMPEIIVKTSRSAKIALNRDADYLNYAKRKLANLDDRDRIKYKKTNFRIIELCNKAISLNRCNPESYYLKGLALLNLEEYDDAIDKFITSLALDSDNLKPRLAIAEANRLNGDYDDAISIYDSVLEIDEESFEALKGKAYVYYDLKDYENALVFFKKAGQKQVLDEDAKIKLESCLEKCAS